MKTSLRMLKRTGFLYSIIFMMFVSMAFAESAQEKGRKIMERVDRKPVLEKMFSDTILHIYNSQGKKIFSKKSRAASFQTDFRDWNKRLSRTLAYFYSPADDKGNSSLMLEKDGKDDDQWVYLKGLRKPKRIVGSDKSSSFMGSDFSNGDISARDIDESNYTWLATESFTFKNKKLKVEKIESAFKEKQKREDYGYSKTIIWMHPGSGLPFQLEYYNLSGQLFKKSRLTKFKIAKNRDGKKVFIPSGMEMKNMLRGTKTIMEMKKIKTGKKATKIKAGIFKLEYMTRRWW